MEARVSARVSSLWRHPIKGHGVEAVEAVTCRRLGPVGPDIVPVHVVRAGEWQAAATTGDYTLVGCSVGPGFDFADFAMLRDDPAAAARLTASHPAAVRFI